MTGQDGRMPDANEALPERSSRKRPLSDAERALLAQQAEEMRRWISTHPAVLDAAKTAQRALEASGSFGAVAQRATEATRPALEAAQRAAEAVRPALEAAAKQAQRITAQWAEALGDLDHIRQLATRAGEMFVVLRAALPPNWPAGVDFESVIAIANDDGIPVVWVPRAEILLQLVEAKDREERVQVLLAHEAELAEDAAATLAEIQHESLVGQTPLAQDALRAWAGGHPAAAQALAVAVIETAVTRLYAQGRKYEKVAAAVKIDLDDDAIATIRVVAALAPIARFYTPWWPNFPTPPPEALSRHVSVHRADVTHYTRANALIAVLLMVSVLRALQEDQEAADAERQIAVGSG